MQEYLYNNFQMENLPAFHAYNYGMNIKIELNEQLRSLFKEIYLCQNNKKSKSLEEEDTSILEDGTQLILSCNNEREVLEAPEEINYQSLYIKKLYKL